MRHTRLLSLTALRSRPLRSSSRFPPTSTGRKPMRIRTLVLFLAAVALAGGTGILVRSFLAQKTAEVEAIPLARPAAPQKSVLVARNAITRGQILKPQDFTWQVWPEGGVDRNYIQPGTRPLESFAGWVARDPFVPGEPISDAKIVSPG